MRVRNPGVPITEAVDVPPILIAGSAIPPPNEPKRSARIKARSETRSEHLLHISFKKGMELHGDIAREAVMKEVRQLVNKQVFHPILLRDMTPEERKLVIPCSVFLKEKKDHRGVVYVMKARMVAGGHRQNPLLYEPSEISSPTVCTVHVMLIAMIAASQRRIKVTADITGAYLNAYMKTIKVRMRIPPEIAAVICELYPNYQEFLQPDGSLFVLLDKALYGCVESAKLWYELLRLTLESIGLIQNPYDACVFNKTVNGAQVTVAFHVDDLFITSVSQKLVDEVLDTLRKKFTDIVVNTGDNHTYLGMYFDYIIR